MRLIDADKLLMHLSDYALQEAPLCGYCQKKDAYEVIQNCMDAVEEQETYNGAWIPVSSRKEPPPCEWLLATVKRHSWISDFYSDWVPEKEKVYHPTYTFVTLARYGKRGGWQILIPDEDAPYLILEDFDGKEDMSQDLHEVLAWTHLTQYNTI